MGILDFLSGGGIQNNAPSPSSISYGGTTASGTDQIDQRTGKPFDYEESTNAQSSEAQRYDANMRYQGDQERKVAPNLANYGKADAYGGQAAGVLGKEQSTADYLQGIANGQGQTAADIAAQQNMNQAVQQQLGMAANAKGGAGQRAAAFRDAQNQGASMQQRAIADNAMRSWQERMGAAQAYGGMASQMAGQYGQLSAQQAQQSQFQAEAADRGRQMGLQGQLGFYGLGQNAETADLNAKTHQYGADTNAGIANAQLQSNVTGALVGAVGSIGGAMAMSDQRAKTDIRYAGNRKDEDRTQTERDYGDYLDAEQFASLSPKDKQAYLQFTAKHPPKDEYAELLGFQRKQPDVHRYPLFDENEPYKNMIDPAGAKQLEEDNLNIDRLLAAHQRSQGYDAVRRDMSAKLTAEEMDGAKPTGRYKYDNTMDQEYREAFGGSSPGNFGGRPVVAPQNPISARYDKFTRDVIGSDADIKTDVAADGWQDYGGETKTPSVADKKGGSGMPAMNEMSALGQKMQNQVLQKADDEGDIGGQVNKPVEITSDERAKKQRVAEDPVKPDTGTMASDSVVSHDKDGKEVLTIFPDMVKGPLELPAYRSPMQRFADAGSKAVDDHVLASKIALRSPGAVMDHTKQQIEQLGHARLDPAGVAYTAAAQRQQIQIPKETVPFERKEKGTINPVRGGEDAYVRHMMESILTSDESAKTEKKDDGPSILDMFKEQPKQFEGHVGDKVRRAVYPGSLVNTSNYKRYKPDVITSDEKAKGGKEDEAGQHNAVSAFLDTLEPYEYRYKNPADAPSMRPEAKGDKYIGVMAQNVERAPTGHSIVGEEGGKKVLEIGPMMSAMAAGLGHVHERLKQLEEENKTLAANKSTLGPRGRG